MFALIHPNSSYRVTICDSEFGTIAPQGVWHIDIMPGNREEKFGFVTSSQSKPVILHGNSVYDGVMICSTYRNKGIWPPLFVGTITHMVLQFDSYVILGEDKRVYVNHIMPQVDMSWSVIAGKHADYGHRYALRDVDYDTTLYDTPGLYSDVVSIASSNCGMIIMSDEGVVYEIDTLVTYATYHATFNLSGERNELLYHRNHPRWKNSVVGVWNTTRVQWCYVGTKDITTKEYTTPILSCIATSLDSKHDSWTIVVLLSNGEVYDGLSGKRIACGVDHLIQAPCGVGGISEGRVIRLVGVVPGRVVGECASVGNCVRIE